MDFGGGRGIVGPWLWLQTSPHLNEFRVAQGPSYLSEKIAQPMITQIKTHTYQSIGLHGFEPPNARMTAFTGS